MILGVALYVATGNTSWVFFPLVVRSVGIIASMVGIMAVGGVFGVMNTMFAAISQRTKDIGVLRILGFARWQILHSFLLETLMIALLGGLIFSMLIAPVLSSLLFPKGTREWHNPMMTWLIGRYRTAVRWAIERRWLTVSVAVGSLMAALYLALSGGEGRAGRFPGTFRHHLRPRVGQDSEQSGRCA